MNPLNRVKAENQRTSVTINRASLCQVLSLNLNVCARLIRSMRQIGPPSYWLTTTFD